MGLKPAADAADNAAADDAAAYAADADAAYADADAAYAEYSRDRDLIESGRTASDLALIPLWSKPDSETYQRLSDMWASLKTYLLTENPDWWVWTEWYEDRLRGGKDGSTIPFVEAIEIGADPENGQYGRATLPTEYYKDPSKANAAIREIIEAYRAEQAALEQDPTAETFDISPDGEISLSTDRVGTGLLAAPTQQDWYAELREAVAEAMTLSPNKLGAAARPLARLSEALPENISDAKVAKIWPRANAIRRLVERNEAIPDGEFEPNRLDPETADRFSAIRDTYNNLRIGDPSLLAADENAISPREAEETLAKISALQPFVREVLDTANVHPKAAETLEEITSLNTDDITLQNKIMGRLEVTEKKAVLRNFSAAIMTFIRDISPKSKGTAAAVEKTITRMVLIEKAMEYREQLSQLLGQIVKSILEQL